MIYSFFHFFIKNKMERSSLVSPTVLSLLQDLNGDLSFDEELKKADKLISERVPVILNRIIDILSDEISTKYNIKKKEIKEIAKNAIKEQVKPKTRKPRTRKPDQPSER